MNAQDFIARLDHVRNHGAGRWAARCPAHPDKNPSLSIREGERGILLHCWAGCDYHDICAALGVRVADLFDDAPTPRSLRPTPKAVRVDRRKLAFQFDLAALDLQLRAEKIIMAGKRLNVATLTDTELNHALGHVAQAHADVERAELFEGVADTLRLKDHTERNSRERQTHAA